MIGLRCHRPQHARTGGQSLVEFALIVPLLIVLLVGVFEFGMILYAHVQVANAAREGARAASLYRSTRYASSCNSPWTLQQTVEQAIVNRVSGGCPQTSGTISYTSLGSLKPAPTPDTWTVTVSATLTDGLPTPGTSGTVVLRYPYQLTIISRLFPYLNNPIWIKKAVAFEYQQ